MNAAFSRGLLVVSVFLVGYLIALSRDGSAEAADTVMVPKSYGSLKSVSGQYLYFEDSAGNIRVLKEKDGTLKDWYTIVRK
jgi:hypothetical protein